MEVRLSRTPIHKLLEGAPVAKLKSIPRALVVNPEVYMSSVAEIQTRHTETEAHRRYGVKLLTAKVVAERCDVPVSTVYEMARQNRIGGIVRLGRNLRFDPVKFEAWLDAGGQTLPGGWRQEPQDIE